MKKKVVITEVNKECFTRWGMTGMQIAFSHSFATVQTIESRLRRSLRPLPCFAQSCTSEERRHCQALLFQDQMVAAGALELLTPLLSSTNSDLINAVVRLLLNLSFDSGVRARMVKAGMLPRLVALLPDPGR